ncbi:hypothetical protein FAGKG844_630009 [Frankia sp. AgKG'84/4]
MSDGDGTPPRAWGRLGWFNVRRPLHRNTPTGVGKTTEAAPGKRRGSEHPHGRGEDNRPAARMPFADGTPPRAWGRLDQGPQVPTVDRNTPTGVGKTRTPTSRRRAPTEHPHGRGEDARTWAFSDRRFGTPPRAWGRLTDPAVIILCPRNTPTGVGKTLPDLRV